MAIIYNGHIVNENTLSIIVPENGKYKLTVFVSCKIVFEKMYASFTAASMVNTKMIKKYHNK